MDLVSVNLRDNPNVNGAERAQDLQVSCLEIFKKIFWKAPKLVRLNVHYGHDLITDVERDAIKQLIDDQQFLSFFSVDGERDMLKEIGRENINEFLRKMFHASYDKQISLQESVMFVLGDGRGGKTSTIAALLGKTFDKDQASTLLLDMDKLFGVDLLSLGRWRQYSDAELHAQRLQRAKPPDLSFFTEEEFRGNTYNFYFEDKLIKETSEAKLFIHSLREDSTEFKSTKYFFRFFDFGGQEVFKSLHPLFLNDNGNYIVVFNMATVYEKKLKDVTEWLKSIHLYAFNTSVMLIGTHYREFMEKQAGLHSNYSDYRCLKELNKKMVNWLGQYNRHIPVTDDKNRFCFFPIENSENGEDARARRIRTHVEKIASGEAEVPRENISKSLRVGSIFFMDFLKRDYTHMTLTEFRLKAREANFEEEEIEKLPKAFSQLGLTLYLEELEKNRTGDSIITLSPPWLVKCLGSFIYDQDLHHLNLNLSDELQQHKNLYFSTGRLTHSLFIFFTKEVGCDSEDRDFLLSCAKNALIMVDYIYAYVEDGEETNQKEYLVTSLLKEKVVNDENVEIEASNLFDMAFHFQHGIPQSFMPQLIASILKAAYKSKRSKEQVYNNPPFLGKRFAQITFDASFGVEVVAVNEKQISFKIYGTTAEKDFHRLNFILKSALEKIKNNNFNGFIEPITERNPSLLYLSEDNHFAVNSVTFASSKPDDSKVIDFFRKEAVPKNQFTRFVGVDEEGAKKKNPRVFVSYRGSESGSEHDLLRIVKRILTKLGAHFECFPLGQSSNKFLDSHPEKSVNVVLFLLTDEYVSSIKTNKKCVKELVKIYRFSTNSERFVISTESELLNWKNWGTTLQFLISPFLLNEEEDRMFNMALDPDIEFNLSHRLESFKDQLCE
eukprot:snap_masked-scaffold_23-processed-gene-5.6-mRNA-1 protein AED:1.00 eAED:1.00 QI:0/0/0/0/1/1/3/0/892